MKSRLKYLCHGLSVVLVSPLLGLYWVLGVLHRSDGLLAGFSQLLSLLPGRTGDYLRSAFFRFTLTKCHRLTVVSFMVLFSQRDTEIEAGVYIGPGCNIGKCSIGRNTLLGSGVHVMSGKGQHNFDDLDKPIKDQGGRFDKIRIGENCWIGNGAMILANIGDDCIVGAGSVVTSDVPDLSIVAGNPAKIIRTRD